MTKRIIPVILFFICLNVRGQSLNSGKRLDYFKDYYNLAIEEMIRSGVPASITLAQGALESGDGNSRLARRGNNHFGIKCHGDWTGGTIRHNDDRRHECFRKYRSVEDSYRDHSDFLSTGQRYAFLFELDPTDYEAWAKGLKQAGYATSRDYANSLIRIIEDYNLQEYDLIALNKAPSREPSYYASASSVQRQILENNRVKYIITREGDSFQLLSAELDKLDWELPRYNNLKPLDSLEPGRIIYLQPKRNKAAMGNRSHTIKDGETMYDISQTYAVKLERLYDLNNIPYGTEPDTGTVLQLRRAVKTSNETVIADEPVPGESEEEAGLEFDLGL